MNANDAYAELTQRWREAALLGSCASLLSWDEQTYLPKGGAEHRGAQMALLAGLKHEKGTDPRIGELLALAQDASDAKDPLGVVAVNLREIKRVHERASKLPKALVEELARVTTLAQQAWVAARKGADFAAFAPWLEKVYSLKRREAEAIGGECLYDALLDEFEPGATSRELAALFESLRRELVPLVAAIAQSPKRPNVAILQREYPVDRQRLFAEQAAAAVGFDFQRGRIDVTAHPFCSGIGPGDTRVTTRFNPRFFNEAFFGVLHEVGHALYEQGLDPDQFGLPMGEAVSLGVHESQSRLWENGVGRSHAFWERFFPTLRGTFPQALADVSLDDFHSAVNAVSPSLIRVEADEVTYNLHILIRFEMEQRLLSGDLRVADVPGAWNDMYQKNLGITPANDAEGCLQDIHWSAGLVGYFPTYTLGNLLAAQLHDAADRDLGGLAPQFARGEFAPLLGWLREKVHSQGQRYPAPQLAKAATGKELSHRPLLEHLRRKACDVHGVDE